MDELIIKTTFRDWCLKFLRPCSQVLSPGCLGVDLSLLVFDEMEVSVGVKGRKGILPISQLWESTVQTVVGFKYT